jgi:hypothetical protein
MPPDMGDMSLDLEAPEGEGEEMGELAMGDDALGELDPQFAADAAEAFPDFDDAQLTALQRAIMGLIGR